MKLRHLSILSALLVCAALSLPAPSSADEVKWPRRLVISVPASGNVVHMIVTALGKTIEEHTPVERVIVQPIGGPASWLPRMEKGQVDLAVHAGPDTVELLQGLGVWKEKTGAKPFLRTVIAGNRNLYGVITVPGKGIEKWPDLKGKVAFFRQPGNPLFDRVGTAILESAGLSEADLKASLTMINFREASTDIIEGRVDAALSTGSGPFIQDPSYIMQYYQTQQQKDALALWADQKQKDTKMPAIVHTTDEATEFTNIMNDIKTYIKEEQVKFIMGTRSMDTFDDFINQIKSMKIDRAIEIKQGALDRFFDR